MAKPFAKQMVAAEEDYLDALRAQLDERARSSDAVLMARAKALLPEFRETVRAEHVLSAELPVRFTLRLGASPVEAEVGDG